ncbi:MAG: hypothetical protein ABMA64_08505 [Myxococcota bacterium]
MTPSVLTVSDPALWVEIERAFPLAGHVVAELDPTSRQVAASFDRDGVSALARAGLEVSIRYRRRTAAEAAAAQSELEERIAGLSRGARRLLHVIGRHAIDGWVNPWSAWDPEGDRAAVRELLGAGMLERRSDDRYGVNPDLPPPPAVPYDFTEAAMDPTDDLSEPRPGPIALLHDLASLAAAIESVEPKRTLTGPITAADRRRLAEHLGVPPLAALEDDPRWGRALRGLEGLGVVSLDPVDRRLQLDLGLDATLAGTTEDAVDHLVHRLVEADLHPAVPAVRAALAAAGDGAVDEVVFADLLFEQHRDVLFPSWQGPRGPMYPAFEGEQVRAYDRDGFDAVEVQQLGRLLGKLERFGLVRRAPGVFAASPDGKRWARTGSAPLPPVWVSSDLEVVVPPDGVTPWERFQLERLGRCVARDVVDRYKLERKGLVRWLRYHSVDEALDLLRRRSPGLPVSAAQTLESWARAADRVVLLRG